MSGLLGWWGKLRFNLPPSKEATPVFGGVAVVVKSEERRKARIDMAPGLVEGWGLLFKTTAGAVKIRGINNERNGNGVRSNM